MTRAIVLTALLFSAAVRAHGIELKSEQIHAESTQYRTDAQYPVTGIAAIDAQLASWARDTVTRFQDEAHPEPGSATATWILDITPSVQRNDDAILSLLFTLTDYTGGAHGGVGFRSFNYRLPGGEAITLDDVVPDERTLQTLSRYAIAELVRKLHADEDEVMRQWIEQGAGPDRKNFAIFLLHEDALEVVFPPYQVASWADGPQQVTIPLQVLSAVPGDTSAAGTPSFDCARATTPIEHAICADADLAALDRDMGARFRDHLDAASADDQKALRQQQREWLRQRDAACGNHAETELVACLTERYRSRLDETDPPP